MAAAVTDLTTETMCALLGIPPCPDCMTVDVFGHPELSRTTPCRQHR